jgi:hypothetical protein
VARLTCTDLTDGSAMPDIKKVSQCSAHFANQKARLSLSLASKAKQSQKYIKTAFTGRRQTEGKMEVRP